MTPPKQATAVVPEIRSDGPLSAEVFVAPRALTVTVAVPQIRPADLDVFLTRHSIRIRSRQNPRAASFLIPLPVAVEPERYVLRTKNGVLDFHIERSH